MGRRRKKPTRPLAAPVAASAAAALPQLVTIDDVAIAIQLSRRTVQRLITDGALPAVRLRFRERSIIRLRREDVEAFLSTASSANDAPKPPADGGGKKP